jgi:hypothetical protein
VSTQQTTSASVQPLARTEAVKTVEAESRVLRERIDESILERLDRLDQRLSALEQRLRESSREAEKLEKGEEEEILPSPRLLGSMDIDRVMKLLEKSDNPLRDVMGYVIVMEALQNIRLNNILIQERLAEMFERRRKKEEADSRSLLEQQFDKLLKLIESRTGTQLSAQDIIALYKEMWSTLKEVKSAIPAVDEEKLVSRIVSEVEKRVQQSPHSASIKDVMGAYVDGEGAQPCATATDDDHSIASYVPGHGSVVVAPGRQDGLERLRRGYQGYRRDR